MKFYIQWLKDPIFRHSFARISLSIGKMWIAWHWRCRFEFRFWSETSACEWISSIPFEMPTVGTVPKHNEVLQVKRFHPSQNTTQMCCVSVEQKSKRIKKMNVNGACQLDSSAYFFCSFYFDRGFLTLFVGSICLAHRMNTVFSLPVWQIMKKKNVGVSVRMVEKYLCAFKHG